MNVAQLHKELTQLILAGHGSRPVAVLLVLQAR